MDISHRHVTAPHNQTFTYNDVRFDPEDRVFLMFSAGNRDEEVFNNASQLT